MPPNPNQFGSKVVLSGDGKTLAVNNRSFDASRPCDLLMFTRDGDLWTQQDYFETPCSANFTLSDDGAAFAFSRGDGTIAVYVRNGSNVWSESANILLSSAPRIESCLDATHGAHLNRCEGRSPIAFSADGRMLAAGDPGTRSVSVYERGADGAWNQRAYVTASVADATDGFGSSVALSADGTTLIVGASGEDSAATGIDGDETDNSVEQSGAAYLFTRAIDGFWTPRTYVKASNTDAGDVFGRSLAISGDGARFVVGATGEDSATSLIDGDQANNNAKDSGAAYAFELENTP